MSPRPKAQVSRPVVMQLSVDVVPDGPPPILDAGSLRMELLFRDEGSCGIVVSAAMEDTRGTFVVNALLSCWVTELPERRELELRDWIQPYAIGLVTGLAHLADIAPAAVWPNPALISWVPRAKSAQRSRRAKAASSPETSV